MLKNLDFEQIGTQFHSWVKNNSNRLFLHKSDDYYLFIRSDFDFYSDLYLKIFSLRNKCDFYFENLYVSSFFTIADSLSYPLFLSPISKIDDIDTIDRKIKIVNKFIDVFTNFRSLQSKTITQSTIRNYIYDLIKEIEILLLTNCIVFYQKKLMNLQIHVNFNYQGYILLIIGYSLFLCEDYSLLH